MTRAGIVFSVLLFTWVSAAGQSGPTTEQLMGRIRAYLGGDERLESVQSLAFKGEEYSYTEKTKFDFVIYLKKPFYQRAERTDGKRRLVVAIDDLEGWVMQERTLESGEVERMVVPMHAGDFRRMLFNTMENLYFYKGIEKTRGEIVNKGVARFGNTPCAVLDFVYDSETIYRRYFDLKTGRLVGSVLEDGVIVREIGVIEKSGIRFPERIETYNGKELTGRLIFRNVVVNPKIPDSLFAYPRD